MEEVLGLIGNILLAVWGGLVFLFTAIYDFAAPQVIYWWNYYSDITGRFSKFATESYYSGILEKYQNVPGYVAGLGLALMLLMASFYNRNSGDQVLKPYLKTLVSISIINGMYLLCNMITDAFGTAAFNAVEANILGFPPVLSVANNMFSALLIVLMVTSDYTGSSPVYTFFFGASCMAASPLLNISLVTQYDHAVFYVLFCAISCGLICARMSKVRYFHMRWLIYFFYHFGLRVFWLYFPLIIGSSQYSCGIDELFRLFYYYRLDLIFFAAVFAVMLLFERVVYSDPGTARGTGSLAP